MTLLTTPSKPAATLISYAEAALANISQGVGVYDRDQRLLLCNRRYGEIYRLPQKELVPGTTIGRIVDLRIAAGTMATTDEGYLAEIRSVVAAVQPVTWIVRLLDGRTLQVRFQPIDGGRWVTIHEDISETTATRSLPSERLSLQALIDQLPDNLWVKDLNSRFMIANTVTAVRMGFSKPADLIGKTDLELLSPEIADKFYADEQEIIRTGRPMLDMEECVYGAAGGKTWILTTKVPIYDEEGEIFGVAGISRDITERRLATAMREGQARILEAIAVGAPLEDILDQIVRLIEFQLTGVFGVVMLLSDDGLHLERGAAPSISDTFAAKSDHIPVGANAASCGAAVFHKQAVVVTDIETDPLWEGYRHLARRHGFRSCWSAPILARGGEPYGAFALYSRTVRAPSDEEQALARVAVHLASIAIGRAKRRASQSNGIEG